MRVNQDTTGEGCAELLTLRLWLAGAEDSLARMMEFVSSRYAEGAAATLKESLTY